MQIIFAGTTIATGPLEGGTDSIQGFLPSKKAAVQWSTPTRAKDATPFARFNRQRTLSGTITPAPYASMGAATAAALTWNDALADTGALVITEGGIPTTFANAVLSELSVERIGVTLIIHLSFAVGPGVTTPGTTLTDGSGAPITDGSGNPLTSQ